MVRPIPNAPSTSEMFTKLNLQRGDLERVLAARSTTDAKGRYFHWEDVRHRDPPEGLTRAQFWLALKLGREYQRVSPELLDKQGKPFAFCNADIVLRQLHEVDMRGPGDLLYDDKGKSQWQHRLRMIIRPHVEEAIQSSLLEGAATTREDAKRLLVSGRAPESRAERMVWNNLQANEFVQQVKDDTLTPAHIRELHRIVTDETMADPADAGRWRLTDDIQVVDSRFPDRAIHIPPLANTLPERIERFCAFANRDPALQPFTHPVIHAILLHFMIGYDHPFVDGNGRTARGLFFWAMARAGYWLTDYLSISRIIREKPAQYMRAYQYTETDEGDTTYFILHQLKVILRAYQDLDEYLKRKLSERDAISEQLESSELLSHLNVRQVTVIGHALKNPTARYRISEHQYNSQVTYQTARTDLLKLVDLGLLSQTKVGRSFEFFPPRDLMERIQNAQTK